MNETYGSGPEGYVDRGPPEKVGGLGNEIYQTIARYFAPMVALYDGIERAFEMKPWERAQLKKDRQAKGRD